MCARRTRTALDAVLIAALGGNFDVLARVLDPLAEEAGEEEGTAVDHIEWASKEFRVHQRRRKTEEPGILRSCHYIRLYRMWHSSYPVSCLHNSFPSDLIGSIC